jgi:hypothetical protein
MLVREITTDFDSGSVNIMYHIVADNNIHSVTRENVVASKNDHVNTEVLRNASSLFLWNK